MLFAMYETHAEKAAPFVYNGLPIVDRDDLMRALQDAAGYELAAVVGKYLDKVEQQASELVDEMYVEKVEEAREAEEELAENKAAIWEVYSELNELLYPTNRLNRDKLRKLNNKLKDLSE